MIFVIGYRIAQIVVCVFFFGVEWRWSGQDRSGGKCQNDNKEGCFHILWARKTCKRLIELFKNRFVMQPKKEIGADGEWRFWFIHKNHRKNIFQSQKKVASETRQPLNKATAKFLTIFSSILFSFFSLLVSNKSAKFSDEIYRLVSFFYLSLFFQESFLCRLRILPSSLTDMCGGSRLVVDCYVTFDVSK